MNRLISLSLILALITLNLPISSGFAATPIAPEKAQAPVRDASYIPEPQSDVLPNPNDVPHEALALAAPAPVPTNIAPEARYQVVPKLSRDRTVSDILRYVDPDAGDTHTFTIVQQPQHGTLVLETDGAFTYTPGSDFDGADFFSWTVSDGQGQSNIAITAIDEMIGVGQSVVVMDTNLDYLHEDMGGGYGEGYHVVGGYDFVDRDSDPYEPQAADSPNDAGRGGHTHGTAVAGIIGSLDPVYAGIAPGADIVHVRTMNNLGNNILSIERVEAVNWIRDHLTSFANPITTINMSFGGAYMYLMWQAIESLNAQGVFVAAGVGDQTTATYLAPLEHPAAYDNVVAVGAATYRNAATDAEIRFLASDTPETVSQLNANTNRHSKMIAAHGYKVTAPRAFTTGTGGYSASSYATPYVSGSAIIIREAMEAVGIMDINQDMIYQVMVDTADSIYDPRTEQSYSEINLWRAVRSVVHTEAGLDRAGFDSILNNRGYSLPPSLIPRQAGPGISVVRVPGPTAHSAGPGIPVQRVTRPTPQAAIANPPPQYTGPRPAPAAALRAYAPAGKTAKKKDLEPSTTYQFQYGLLVQSAK